MKLIICSLYFFLAGTLQCFIHAVSPVKKGASSGKKYFNCTLQAKDSVLRGVCFNMETHSEISNMQRSKSLVGLQNIRINDNNGKKYVIILKQINITPGILHAKSVIWPVLKYSGCCTKSI